MSGWVPDYRDEEIISAWFDDLDESNAELVGGAKIVQFLMKSDIDKLILRTIWELADQEKKGSVNLQQFTLIIRLVSLACSPRFEGMTPSMEIYKETISDRIPLPYQLVAACEATKELSKAPMPTERRPSGGVANASPGGAQNRSNSGEQSHGGGRMRSSSGDLKVSPARRRSSGSNKRRDSYEVEWLPSLSEERQIDAWFDGLDTANPKSQQVGGAAIVQFLMQSGTDKVVLRDIWQLADKEGRGWVNKKQFMLIMRLVAIAKAGQEPSLDKYKATVTNSYAFPLPELTLPVATAPVVAPGLQQPQPQQQPQQQPQPQPQMVMHTPDNNNCGWVPQPHEAAVLDRWYVALDQTGEQRVGGAAIVGFLLKSGLPKDVLRSIWALGDAGGKGWVSKAEFCLIIRMVALCRAQGGEPSMDRYYASRSDTSISLPPLEETEGAGAGALAVAGAGAGMMPITSPQPHTQLPPSQEAAAAAVATTTLDMEWVPQPHEVATINHWFESLSEGHLTIGGAKIVPFLLKSGASKEALRECWELGDSNSTGRIDCEQFTRVVRLVMVSLASTRAGGNGIPTMAMYHATAGDSSLPLPPLGVVGTEEEKKIEFMILSSMAQSQSPPRTALAAAPAADDDFGDFAGSGTQSQSQPQVVVDNDDFGDDFGDFSAATADTTTGSGISGASDTYTNAFSPDLGTTSSVQGMFPSVAVVEAVGAEPVAAGGMSAFDTLGSDNSNNNITAGDGAEPGLGLGTHLGLSTLETTKQQQQQQEEDDWGDFTTNPATTISTTTTASVFTEPEPQVQPQPEPKIDAWGAFDEVAADLPPAPPPIPSFGPTSPTSPHKVHREAAASLSAGLSSFTPKELGELSTKLLLRNRYEQAYLAARQKSLLELLDQLSEEKSDAVSNDDLEKAVECKKKIVMVSNALFQAGEEDAWAATATTDNNTRDCTSLEESVELLESVDEASGSRCRQTFIRRHFPSSDALTEARFHVQAKRTVRLLLALHTTHTGYDRLWPAMLEAVRDHLMSAKLSEIVKFKALSHADRVSAGDDDRLSTYARGIVAIAELGLSIATTVMECGPTGKLTEVHVAQAREMESLAHSVLIEARDLWAVRSRLLDAPSISIAVAATGSPDGDPVELLREELLDCPTLGLTEAEAGGGGCDDDTNMGGGEAPFQVVYCNMTLRPVALKRPGSSLAHLRAATRDVLAGARGPVADVTGEGELWYLQGATDYFRHEFENDLPETAGPFYA
jgi:Ca2+-binding EF-hand superfamily protein